MFLAGTTVSLSLFRCPSFFPMRGELSIRHQPALNPGGPVALSACHIDQIKSCVERVNRVLSGGFLDAHKIFLIAAHKTFKGASNMFT